MVYWKSNRSTERLLSAIFAAHPNLKLDAHAIALCYGEGASQLAIENRIRLHRKQGEKLQDEAGGVDGHTRYGALTPRTPRNRETKSKSKTKSPSHKTDRRLEGYPPLSDSETSEQETPSKKPKLTVKSEKSGSTLMDPICLVGSEGSGGTTEDEDGAVPVKKEKAGDDEDVQVVKGGPAIKKEHRCTPAPVPASGSSRQALHRLPSLPAILSQSRVNSQSCAYTDGRVVRGEWKGGARGRAASTEKTKAYASRDGSVYLG